MPRSQLPWMVLHDNHWSKVELGPTQKPPGNIGQVVEGFSAVGWMMCGEDLLADKGSHDANEAGDVW